MMTTRGSSISDMTRRRTHESMVGGEMMVRRSSYLRVMRNGEYEREDSLNRIFSRIVDKLNQVDYPKPHPLTSEST